MISYLIGLSQVVYTNENKSDPLKQNSALQEKDIETIEKFIHEQMNRGKIPGMSVVIVKGDKTIYKEGFGFANIRNKQPVTPNTLFELGANSKAFTALGILLLKEQGNIKLDDLVEHHIPWFIMKYKGEKAKITIKHLLYEISGIAFETIGDIPAAKGDDALENTVRLLKGEDLKHYPGEKFSFASLNYDVLGLIIQMVSGESFEKYVKNSVLMPLGMKNTYLFREEAVAHGMAMGYKIGFGQPREFDAPIYRGNTPAGYFITNAKDMSKWLKIQIGTDTSSNFPQTLIEESHKTDLVGYGYPYAKGWFVSQNVQIFQAGNNPNFSSFIMIGLEEKVGVAVLANMNSDFVEITGRGIFSILQGKAPVKGVKDFNTNFDNISIIVIYITIPLILLAILLIAKSIYRVFKEKRRFTGKGIKGIIGFAFSSLLMISFTLVLYNIPPLLSYDLPWRFVYIWMPVSFIIAIILVLFTGFLYYAYFLYRFFFPRSNDGKKN
jgi:CubicO group peptidase (beta-lactamase class C family)